MIAARLHNRSGAASLVYEDAPMPEAQEGEVLVRVHAAAVTPTELQWSPTYVTRTGEPRPLPFTMGHEFSGEIRALGPGVSDLARGDAVFGMNDWFRDGAQAEYCVARATEVARKPVTVDHVHAAATPISALTAWQGLIDRAQLTAGQRVLVHGASGGVGIFAVQLARRRRAHVIGTCSAANADLVRQLGADRVIDYRSQRFEDAAGHVDVVFDTVGGDTLDRSWSVLEPGGRLITVAASAGKSPDPRVRAAFFIVEARRTQLEEIARLIDTGGLRVVVGAVFPLAEARRAYEEKPARGKAVLTIVS